MAPEPRKGTKGSSDPFALLVLSVLFGLTLKSALEHTFAGIDSYATLKAVSEVVQKRFEEKGILFAKFVVFVFTLLRFYLGAFRFTVLSQNQGTTERSINAVGTLLVFSGFFLTSLALKSEYLFYWTFIVFLILDLIWFFILFLFCPLPTALTKVAHVYVVFDVLTVVPVLFLLWLANTPWNHLLALADILVIGIWDLYWLRRFYRNDESWETQTLWLDCIGRKGRKKVTDGNP